MALPSAECEVTTWLHCKQCEAEWRERGGMSMAVQHERLSIGRTPIGLQVWCRVHNRNVAHFAYPEDMKPIVNFEAANKRAVIPKRSWWW